MGVEVVSGICATRGATDENSDATFIWNLEEHGKVLKVKVAYGGSTYTNNAGEADIPWESENPVKVKPAANPAITVDGTVQAEWSADKKSYVVSFSGMMVRPNVNNVFSSDVRGPSGNANPIIVGAFLAA